MNDLAIFSDIRAFYLGIGRVQLDNCDAVLIDAVVDMRAVHDAGRDREGPGPAPGGAGQQSRR